MIADPDGKGASKGEVVRGVIIYLLIAELVDVA